MLNPNLTKFDYPEFFSSKFETTKIDSKFEGLAVEDKARVVDRIVNMIFDAEYDSPAK